MHINPSPASSGALTSAPYAGASVLRMALVIALAVLVSGCGLKGPLYLPEKSAPVVITPAAESASSSSSSASSSTSATP